MPARHWFTRFILTSTLLVMLSLAAGAGLVKAQQAPPTVQNCAYDIRSGVPFVWLRFESSSQGSIARTVYPGQTSFTLRQDTWYWDGVQWWVGVFTNLPNAKSAYWVEFGSLTPRCQSPTVPPPTAVPSSGQPAAWYSGMFVLVRPNVPFVWFRAVPSPSNPSMNTVFSNAALLVAQSEPAIDNFGQWWWQVRDPASGKVGWVEEWALQPGWGNGSSPVPPSPIPSGGWQIGNTVRVRAALPFSWLRTVPSSLAPSVFTAKPNQELILVSGPQSDGVQLWWSVIVPGLGPSITGWVEEGSLEFVRS